MGQETMFKSKSAIGFLSITVALSITGCGSSKPVDEGAAKGELISGIDLSGGSASLEYAKNYISISNLVAKKGIVDGHAYIGAKLKNNGKKAVSDIELTVFFYDNGGNIIHDGDIKPLRLYYTADIQKPLKPGYIRQLRVDEEFIIADIPSEWSGEISGKITGVSFD